MARPENITRHLNCYEAKQEARRARYLDRAERADAQAALEFDKADLREEKSGIPFGQPILVGHHSERRHRAAIDRAHKAMQRGIDASSKADHYRAKAAGVGLGGISSDDPDAIGKLREKLERLQASHEQAKQWNAQYRKGGVDAVDAPESIRNTVRETMRLCPWIKAPFGSINATAEIRRLKDRIAQLEQLERVEDSEEEINGATLRCAASENRVQIIFGGKPSDEVRADLKRSGFRWARSVGAWQRNYGNTAMYHARRILQSLA